MMLLAAIVVEECKSGGRIEVVSAAAMARGLRLGSERMGGSTLLGFGGFSRPSDLSFPGVLWMGLDSPNS